MSRVLRFLAHVVSLIVAIPFMWYGFGLAAWNFTGIVRGNLYATVSVLIGIILFLYGVRLLAFAAFGDAWTRSLAQHGSRQDGVAG